jgi:hypothetical protein
MPQAVGTRSHDEDLTTTIMAKGFYCVQRTVDAKFRASKIDSTRTWRDDRQ